MKKIILYKNTFVFSALFLKRGYQPSGKLSIKDYQFNKYLNSVINAIEAAQKVDDSFYYVLNQNGEPDYYIPGMTPEMQKLQESAQFYHSDIFDTYYSDSDAQALLLKSIAILPPEVARFATPKDAIYDLELEARPTEVSAPIQNIILIETDEPGL